MPNILDLRLFFATERCVLHLSPGDDLVVRRTPDRGELHLSDPSISRDSAGVASLRRVGNTLCLVPRSSTTPILLNGNRLVDQEQRTLRPGDRIRIGYSTIVVQAIEGLDADSDVKTVKLNTSYVEARDQLGSATNRLAQWSEGFMPLKDAKDEREAAEVILEQLERLVPSDRALLAAREKSENPVGFRELASRGFSAGEIEQLVRWFNDNQTREEIWIPTAGEVWGGDSAKRVAVGRLDADAEQWQFYLEPLTGMAGWEAGKRCMSLVSNLLQLYYTVRREQGQERLLKELTHSISVISEPTTEFDYAAVAEKFVSRSESMRAVCELIARAAVATSPVLLLGEPGTGKQLAAEAIHEASHRRHLKMVAVNIAEYPDTLVESALFGQVRGAFTGAVDRPGLLEEANRSSLFLDELGEIPLSVQAKLLRVLEHSEFRRLGDAAIRRSDIRIISATNRDLLEEIRSGNFRQDLYDRLSVIPIRLPPLRDRPEDIALLGARFLEHFNRQMQKQIEMTPEGMRHLRRFSWPDNVRGLKNYIERVVALADFGPCLLGPDDLPQLGRPLVETAQETLRVDLDGIIEGLRRKGRNNQARILSAFKNRHERLTKKAWVEHIGISQPVFRAELRSLIVHALKAGVPIEFFEERVSLRREDWDSIGSLTSSNESVR